MENLVELIGIDKLTKLLEVEELVKLNKLEVLIKLKGLEKKDTEKKNKFVTTNETKAKKARIAKE